MRACVECNDEGKCEERGYCWAAQKREFEEGNADYPPPPLDPKRSTTAMFADCDCMDEAKCAERGYCAKAMAAEGERRAEEQEDNAREALTAEIERQAKARNATREMMRGSGRVEPFSGDMHADHGATMGDGGAANIERMAEMARMRARDPRPGYKRAPDIPQMPKAVPGVYHVICRDYNVARHLVDLIEQEQIPDLYHSVSAAEDARARYPLGANRAFKVYTVNGHEKMPVGVSTFDKPKEGETIDKALASLGGMGEKGYVSGQTMAECGCPHEELCKRAGECIAAVTKDHPVYADTLARYDSKDWAASVAIVLGTIVFVGSLILGVAYYLTQ